MRNLNSVLAKLKSKIKRDENLYCFYCKVQAKDMFSILDHEKICKAKIDNQGPAPMRERR